MELIEDLGFRPSKTIARSYRFGLYKCPVCKNLFEAMVSNVKSGKSTKCGKCAHAELVHKKIMKASGSFISGSIEVHGDRYDYSLVNYITSTIPVKIICKEHGIFEQTPNTHKGGHGCPSCAGNSNKVAADTFIHECTLLHGSSYEYNLVEYKNSNTKVKIVCHSHGVFEQTPTDHKGGHGCPSCAGNSNKVAAESFEMQSSIIHDYRYNYSLVDYVHNKAKVKIICPIHGVFEQTPNDHKSGYGCPSCARNGFDKNKSALLYYLRINCNDIVAYKIGITNRTVKARFTNEDLTKITILKTWSYPLGTEAYDKEQEILKMYANYKYTGEPLLSSGNTELFTIDVLGLDEESLC